MFYKLFSWIHDRHKEVVEEHSKGSAGNLFISYNFPDDPKAFDVSQGTNMEMLSIWCGLDVMIGFSYIKYLYFHVFPNIVNENKSSIDNRFSTPF